MSASPSAAETAPLPADEPARLHSRRAPLAGVTASLMAGILVDRWLAPGASCWMCLAAISVGAAWLLRRRSLFTLTAILLIGCVAVGGLRHQLVWWSVPDDDLSRLATSTPQPIRVKGIVLTPIVRLAADESELTPPWQQIDRSMCQLRCDLIETADRSQPVRGVARLTVTGDLLHVGVGDRVEVIGQLIAPGGPTNPGGFDFRGYLHRQGVRTLITCDHPEGVKRLAEGVSGRFARWRADLRQECQLLLLQHLNQRTGPLASSLLLGERSELPAGVRDAFVDSGTMHLLAISGLHVGILAGLLLLLCRLLNSSTRVTTLVVLAGIGLFLCITNLRPPVVRASVLAVAVAAGWPMYRRLGAVNLIALCALVILSINPTDLFDTGTQLSFLAVVAIGWAGTFISRQRQSIDEEGLLPSLLSRKPGIGHTMVRFLTEGYIVTLAIWLFTLPLTAAQFHVAAPVGLVINVLLIPYVAIVLSLGFCTLAVGLLVPWIAGAPALLFNASLQGLLHVVDAASALRLGHADLAGPTAGWLIVFYLLLAIVLMGGHWIPLRRWGWSLVWGWVIAGQLVALWPDRRAGLRCTVLDVGHGCCVVLQLPGGENVLYDAGMFAGEQRGVRVIQSALWELGIHQIDGILVSHADVDHFNAAAELMRSMPVGALLCDRSFLDFQQSPVTALCNAASEARVPLRLVQGGDRLVTRSAEVQMTILHPADGWRSDEDNANSVVLSLTFAGRTLLLAGDLDQDGLHRLLAMTPQTVDILLAPHHGSRLANPPALADWAKPKVVLVSGGTEQTDSALARVYRSAERVLTTLEQGAITLQIDASGQLQVWGFGDDVLAEGSTPM